jgi:hypothetical protein
MPTGQKNSDGENNPMHGLRKNGDATLFGIAAFLLLIGFSLYYVKLAGVEGRIIIHFLGGRGADFLGEKYNALHMLFSGTIITVLNACLAGVLYGRNPVLARLVSAVTAFMALLIVITISCIITVN